jgi:peptidoglycan hydrolase-like protein with peptidoglycan-binding domain
MLLQVWIYDMFENLTIGSKGDTVALVQRALNEVFTDKTKFPPNLKVDGEYGPALADQVKLYQQLLDVPMTGVVDDATWAILGKYIEIRFITEAAFDEGAAILGCPPAHIRGVTEVEAKGSGFLPSGDLVILFERHWFYKKFNEALSKDPALVTQAAKILGCGATVAEVRAEMTQAHSDIYNPNAGGYLGGQAEWLRQRLARTFCNDAGLQATSYGLFQIMGFNYSTAGYKSVQDMYMDYSKGERAQFGSFCKFILSDVTLLRAVRQGDAALFAPHYNGPAYKENSYDTKIATAINKWKAYYANKK